MSSSQSHPGGGEGDRLKPASSPKQQYGTFARPLSDPASSAAQPPIGSMSSGYQSVADDSDTNNTTGMGANHADDGGVYGDEDDTESGAGDGPIARPPHLRHLTRILVSASIIALFTLAAFILYPSQPLPPSSPAPAPPRPSTSPVPSVKILVVGDSITQGHEGDYTWRYRLWEWLRASSPHANVTFVGPYSGTFPPPDAPPPPRPQPTTPGLETRTWGGYARDVDSSFLLDTGGGISHFAHWGRQAGQVRGFVGDMVGTYRPDYVLMALGFNDLAWVHTVEETLDSVRRIVAGAREAKRDVRFAVANVPQRTGMVGREWLPDKIDRYNAVLERLVRELAREESPVWLVRLREGYQCEVDGCPASHDGLHPNTLGEFQIAQAFSQVLHEKYGLGDANFTIPSRIPLRPCRAPGNVKVVKAVLERNVRPIVVTWDSFYGAFGYFVNARRKGWGWGGDMFTDLRQYGMFWPGDGQEWEVRVKSYCGDQQDHSPWSDTVSVRT